MFLRFVTSVLFIATIAPAALAHPGGPAVSVGSNPVRSAAGVIVLDSTYTAPSVIAAPAEYDLILTDVILGVVVKHDSGRMSGSIRLEGSDGTLYGAYSLRGGRPDIDNSAGESRQLNGLTGIRIPAGTSLSVVWVDGYRSYPAENYNITYVLAGYLAQP